MDKRDNSASVFVRLRDMLIGWGTVGVIYTFSGFWQGIGWVLPESALDRMIAFNPAGIWLYMSFFVFVPYAFLRVDASRLRWLRNAMITCAVLCGLIFMLWPTTILYPDGLAEAASAQAPGLGATLLRLLLWGDSTQNCLPSLHAALTLLCAWALLDRRHPWRSVFAVVATVCICFSILQLRRHLAIDVAAGLVAGLFSGWLCLRWPAWGFSRKGLPS